MTPRQFADRVGAGATTEIPVMEPLRERGDERFQRMPVAGRCRASASVNHAIQRL